MDWFNNWVRDMVYMLSGIVLVVIAALSYTVFQLLEDWLQRRYTRQAKQPQKVEGKVKPPMGFL